MAHARRKFDVAKDNDPQLASHALLLIQQLYAIERKVKDQDLTSAQIKEVRLQEASPVLNELKEWLDETYPKVLPKSAIGKAIAYSLKIWPQLTGYTQNWEWLIDNNTVETKIRPLALGRKNYLFAGSHKAAQQAAMMYSFFGTCKMNEVQPLEWLTQTLHKLPDTKLLELHKLLPCKKIDA